MWGNIVSVGIGLLIGFAVGLAWANYRGDPMRRLNEIIAFNNDPDHIREHGPAMTSFKWQDPRVALAECVRAGQLIEVRLVFPSVPVTEAVQHSWMDYCERAQPEILFAQNDGESIFTERLHGERVLALQLWYRPEAAWRVNDLIDLIQSKHGIPATTPAHREMP
mgnify:CR=1 FL=1